MCQKIVAATVREILAEPEPHATVRTLTITDGILGDDARCKTSVFMGHGFRQTLEQPMNL